MNKTINILYCGNFKVFDGILTSLLSIVKYNKEPLNIFFLTMDLQDMNKDFRSISERELFVLNEIIKKANSLSKISKIDLTEKFRKELLKSPNIITKYTPYIFLRLFAEDLDKIPNKILYLDADIMLLGDIRQLYDINVENYEYAAARDYYGKFFFYPNYINSGVLLLNMKKIRETKLFKRTLELVCKKRIFLPDQTALNKLTKHKLIISSKFNSQRRIKKETIVRHFCKTIRFFPFFHTVNVKQWDIERVHSFLKCYVFDDIFEKYLKIKEVLNKPTSIAKKIKEVRK